MSVYECYDDAFDPKYGDPHPVPIVMATKDTLEGYGTIVDDFEDAEVDITPWPVKGKLVYSHLGACSVSRFQAPLISVSNSVMSISHTELSILQLY